MTEDQFNRTGTAGFPTGRVGTGQVVKQFGYDTKSSIGSMFP